METTALTRRQFLAVSGVALFVKGKKRYALENDALSFGLTITDGIISAKSIANKLIGRTIALPAEEFLLEFADGSTVSSAGLQVRFGAASDRSLELLFANESRLEVKVHYSLAASAHYLRKQISVRHRGETGGRLLRVDLENWRGVARDWKSMLGDRLRFGSHPIFCDDIWAGVEFVAAFNEYGPDGFTLRSRPGGVPLGANWLDLRSTVVGVAQAARVRDAFLRYIEDIRLAPARMVACYNSWWTLPKVVKQQDNLALINQLKAAMFDRHGVFFDIITTDMGWSDPRSIWEIDRSILPRGFDDIREIVEPAGGRLGLWMSPSETYPPVCDYEWAEKSGYVVVRPDESVPATQRSRLNKPGVSLADPRYREETKAKLRTLIRENRLAHIKYDGFWPIEHRAHHDLLPALDSVEPLAAHSLELLQASKAENPALVTEPTYMNSMVGYISPWILKYSDTVWANGEDCVVGIGPAPDYRESHTNAREFMIFQAEDQVWLPQNAVHYFDIVHVDATEGFPNHAAMAFGRGRFFLSTYVNPKLMSDDDWRIYTGLLRWARRNTELLRQTVMVSSRVELGEPYLYAHWLGRRGLLVVRNPSNESQEFVVDLSKAGAPTDLTRGICYTQYPYRRGIAADLSTKSSVRLTLAPWEVLYLEIVPRAQLQEAVVLGARWFRQPGGTLAIAPDADVESVRLMNPGEADRVISVSPRVRERIAGELLSHTARPLPENEWLPAKPRTTAVFPFRYPADFNRETIQGLKDVVWKDLKWKNVPSVGFEIECSVSVPPQASSGKVLLLVEFPGREHRPSRCDGWVDGRQLTLEERNSDEHIGYYNWTGKLRPVESEWSWYICGVPSGTHRARFTGAAGHPDSRFAVWAWADHDLTNEMQPTSYRCSDPAVPQYLDRFEREGICLMPRTTMRG